MKTEGVRRGELNGVSWWGRDFLSDIRSLRVGALGCVYFLHIIFFSNFY